MESLKSASDTNELDSTTSVLQSGEQLKGQFCSENVLAVIVFEKYKY